MAHQRLEASNRASSTLLQCHFSSCNNGNGFVKTAPVEHFCEGNIPSQLIVNDFGEQNPNNRPDRYFRHRHSVFRGTGTTLSRPFMGLAR